MVYVVAMHHPQFVMWAKTRHVNPNEQGIRPILYSNPHTMRGMRFHDGDVVIELDIDPHFDGIRFEDRMYFNHLCDEARYHHRDVEFRHEHTLGKGYIPHHRVEAVMENDPWAEAQLTSEPVEPKIVKGDTVTLTIQPYIKKQHLKDWL